MVNEGEVGAHLPRHKAHGLDDGRLDNLLPREHAPGDSIRPIRARVRAQVAVLVDHVVRDVAVLLDVREK